LSGQGIISANQQQNLKGVRLGDALPEVRRAPPWHGRGNAAMAAFSRPSWRARPGFGPGVTPGPLSPDAYKYPMGSEEKQIQRIELYFCVLLLEIIVALVCFF